MAAVHLGHTPWAQKEEEEEEDEGFNVFTLFSVFSEIHIFLPQKT